MTMVLTYVLVWVVAVAVTVYAATMVLVSDL